MYLGGSWRPESSEAEWVVRGLGLPGRFVVSQRTTDLLRSVPHALSCVCKEKELTDKSQLSVEEAKGERRNAYWRQSVRHLASRR